MTPKNTHAASVKPVKYLVCVNDSEHSRVALKFVCARAQKRGSLIDLLHVLEPSDFQGIMSVADKIREEARKQGEAFLNTLAEEVQQSVGITPSLLLREGDVEDAIINTIQDDLEVHMLVLGASPETNGRHAHITGLVKSLGDRLLIPLVVIPGNMTDAQIEQVS